MDSFIDDSSTQIKEFFLDLQSRFKEAAQLCSRQYEKKIKQQDDEMRQLKEKLTKKDEILKFHEEEINALRKQVKSLKTERPLCPSCSHRDEGQDPKSAGRKRNFSPDSSCALSVENLGVTEAAKTKEKFSGKRRRTGEPLDNAFFLDKTPEEVKAQEASAAFHVNELSPASVKSEAAGGPQAGPQVGDSLAVSQRDSVVEESPPLIPLRAAAQASALRRSSVERLGTRSSRARQMKLHTLTFAPKRDLSLLVAKETAGNLQDLEETVLEAPRPETRRNAKDRPFVGSSPSEAKLFKKPKLPGAEKERSSLDPIACSTLKLSDASQAESVVFGPSERTPLSPKNDNVVVEKKKQFKFVGDVERKKSERRNLEGFSCYECYEYYRGSNLTDEEMNEKIRHCSRHRAKHAPPSTPEGFWDVDLPSTPVNLPPLDVQRKRRRKPYQFPKKE